MSLSPKKLKESLCWDRDAICAIWFTLLFAYFGLLTFFQTSGMCTRADTPLVFKFPALIWPEHPVLLSWFMLAYVGITFAVYLYGAVLTCKRDSGDVLLGRFYVGAARVVSLAFLAENLLFLLVWMVACLARIFLAALHTVFYRVPRFLVSVPGRMAARAERKRKDSDVPKPDRIMEIIRDIDNMGR